MRIPQRAATVSGLAGLPPAFTATPIKSGDGEITEAAVKITWNDGKIARLTRERTS